MQRRTFIRWAGSTGLITTAGLSGCSSAMPASAIEAWRGPGNETDLRRWVLGHALLAPHSHNLQSWLVELRGSDTMLLHCDLARLLPQTDPQSRQIMMSHGTFLELVDLAARERGQRAEIELFPDGVFGPDKPDSRPVARIRLIAEPGIAKDPLFAQILHRHTNRNAYDPARPVSTAQWQAMAQAAARPGLTFGFVGSERAETIAEHRRIANEAWRLELTTPHAIMESYRWLRVGAAEIDAKRDGLSLTETMPVLMDKLGLFDRSKTPAADDFAITGQIKAFAEKIASTPGFLWMVSDGNARATQVNAGRAYARVQLAATALGLAMQPLQQALQEYPEQAGPYARIRTLLGVAPAQTVQMWARVGYAEPVTPAPRRGLDAIIRA